MTISAADWFAASDPFKQVPVLIGTPNPDYTTYLGNEGFVAWIEGALNGVHDDPDIQEIVLKETASPYGTIKLDGFQIQGVIGDKYYQTGEFGEQRTYSGGAYNLYAFPFAVPLQSEGDTNDLAATHGRFKNTSSTGVDVVGLSVTTAIHWPKCDPAQIIMCMLHHYLPDTYGGNGLRDFMNQTSFEDASEDFYDMRTLGAERSGYNMTVVRDVDKSIRQQVEDIIKQTPDFLAVRPADDDGNAELHYIRRDLATERTTVINFDDGTSGVRDWRGGVDDNLIVDEIEYEYGTYVTSISGNAASNINTNWNIYQTKWSSPPDLNKEGYKKSHIRRLDRDITKLKLHDVLYGYEIDRFWQIYWWGESQEDIAFKQGPLHFNYEIGDLVHIECEGLGLDGNEFFLVYEKTVDLDTLEAKVRVQRVYGFRGVTPARMFKPNDHTRWWYRCETLARQPQGALAHYPSASWQPRNISDTEWIDGSGWKSNAILLSGSTGSGYVQNSEDSPLNGWPVLLNDNGFELQYDAGSETTTWELWLVIRHQTGTFTGDEYLYYTANAGGSGTITSVQLYKSTEGHSWVIADGVGDGSVQLCNDTNWHIYAISVEGANPVGTLYEETTVLEYLTLSTGHENTGTLNFLSVANALHAKVYIAEAFWLQKNTTDLTLTTQQRLDLVEYLREKYDLG